MHLWPVGIKINKQMPMGVDKVHVCFYVRVIGEVCACRKADLRAVTFSTIPGAWGDSFLTMSRRSSWREEKRLLLSTYYMPRIVPVSVRGTYIYFIESSKQPWKVGIISYAGGNRCRNDIAFQGHMV